MITDRRNRGFSILLVLIVVTVILLVAVFFIFLIRQVRGNDRKAVQNTIHDIKTKSERCELSPKVIAPVDIQSISSFTYPGQQRDGVYATMSRLNVKSSTNDVNITLPLKSKLISGSRYTDKGETQYMLTFETNCKIRISYDHLSLVALELMEDVSKLVETSKDAKEATQLIGKEYDLGTVVATKIGYPKTNNAFFDFGMYDFNSVNRISNDADWAKAPIHSSQEAIHGVCWMNYLGEPDKLSLQALTPSGILVPTGDYCK